MPRMIEKLLVFMVGGCFCLMVANPSAAQQPLEVTSDPVRIEDLGLEGEIPSAIDLVGPQQGSAGAHRTALARRLQCWIDGTEGCVVADVNDPRIRAIRQFLARGPSDRDGSVDVQFPDQTRVSVRLERVADLDPHDWDQRVYEPIVPAETIQAPGLAEIPSRPEHFEDFSYDVTPAIRDALERLKQRF